MLTFIADTKTGIKPGDRFVSGKQKFKVLEYNDNTVTVSVGLSKRASTMELPWRYFASELARGTLKKLEET